MILIEQVLGNLKEPHWHLQANQCQVDHLFLDQWTAQKNRFRKKTKNGIELAVSLQRNLHLHHDDVIFFDPEKNALIVVEIELCEVMVVEVQDILKQSPEGILQIAFELGHALGNQHWPALMKNGKIFVPLAVDRKVMSSVMHTHNFTGITFNFVPGQEIIPYLAPHEARKLFGGMDATPHRHHEH
ncbi:MAG: urease accessory protein UreE [Gammaproteobacteria bacterium RIFCSPHIGHO2_12_FULL_45_9]|nr:MAG: urease accessory protein UreE [Gammaproteobacteria bacterium RIFCSPHIGHO2_12_FULL_45_9]